MTTLNEKVQVYSKAQTRNADGILDLVMAGNNYEFKPQFSRLDAGYGTVLLGDGQMGFAWQTFDQSGFFLKEEVKYLRQLQDSNGKRYMLAATNNSQPRLFQMNE